MPVRSYDDLSGVTNYYMACGYTDLRGGDRQNSIVMMQYDLELRGQCGLTDRIKALYWCGDGRVLDNMRYLSKTPADTKLEAMMPWNPGLKAQLGTISWNRVDGGR